MKINSVETIIKPSAIIRKLKTDPIRNSSILGFISNYKPTKILSVGESFLVKAKSDVEWTYISCNNLTELRALLSKISSAEIYFASLEDWMISEVIKDREVDWKLDAVRYFLPESVLLPANAIEITTLRTSHAEFIFDNSNYKQYIEPEYVKERISKSFSAAVIENAKLAAWALTHDDGAIGVLHVLDEYRGRNYASEIVIHLSKKIRGTGTIPIAQIEEKNNPAIKLFSKIGFVKDRKVTWIKFKR